MDGPMLMLRPDEAALFRGQPKDFPFGDFRVEDVMLPEGDDMGIPSDDDDIDEDTIEQETGFETVVVVDGLPVVGADKVEKLTAVLRKLFNNEKLGEVREGGFYLPLDAETKGTKGYAFIEYYDQATARRVAAAYNNYAFDKKHTLVACLFNEFDKYARVPDEYVPPEPKPFEPMQGLLSWLTDRRGRDQFVVRLGEETEIYWNDAQRAMAEEVYRRSLWTESFVQWSPLGSMMATMHTKGVALWGSADFKRLQRVMHPGVRLIEFSPNERFLVTYSTIDPANPRDTAAVLLNVFDVRSGKKLRAFEGKLDEYAVGSAAAAGGALKWPVFKWAGGCDDQYFARLGRGFISVFETPDCGLLDKKSIKLEGVTDFSWSPADPILCAFQTEQAGGNQPARVSLIQLPDRRELRQKNLFSVSDVSVHWHPQGLYLAVRVDHYTKTKKSTFTSFELFSIKEKDIPMEVMELPTKSDKVYDFAWEPKGHRFAVLHGEGPQRPNVSFFSMKDAKGNVRGVVPLGTLNNRPCNQLLWSPQGKNILLAGLKALNGQLTFFNADEFEVMNTAEHFLATDAEWDPTGRYVGTSVNALHTLMENGFVVWSFNGQELYKQQRDRLQQFSWRPRPPSLLSPEQEREITRNLKKYSRRYEEEDATLGQEEDVKLKEERERLMAEWNWWVESKKAFVEAREAGMRALLGDRYNEGEYTISEVAINSVVDVKEEPWRGSQ